uniref:Uncharacterized protein n=2 Tax=Cacopsylla melanoneura TaxID=428564 RepID=A0A8D9A3U4_9HEMI
MEGTSLALLSYVTPTRYVLATLGVWYLYLDVKEKVTDRRYCSYTTEGSLILGTFVSPIGALLGMICWQKVRREKFWILLGISGLLHLSNYNFYLLKTTGSGLFTGMLAKSSQEPNFWLTLGEY